MAVTWRWEIWRYASGYSRLAVPATIIADWDAEVTAVGGPGQASILLSVPRLDAPVDLCDRCDLYCGDMLVYQGWVREIEDAGQTQTRLVIDGYSDWLDHIIIPTDYASPGGTVTDAVEWLYNLALNRLNDAPTAVTLYYDIDTISTAFETASWARQSVKSALDDIAKVHRLPVVYGLFPKAGGAQPEAWLVFKQSAPTEADYTVPTQSIISLDKGASAKVINAVRIVGAGQKNEVANPDFRQAVLPTALNGNLLQDGSFEQPGPARSDSYGTYPSGWWGYPSAGNGPSRYQNNHPKWWFLKSRTGNYMIELDAQGEAVYQTVPASPGDYVLAVAFAGGDKAGQSNDPAVRVKLEALDASQTVIATPINDSNAVLSASYTRVTYYPTLPAQTAYARVTITQENAISTPNVALIDDVLFAPQAPAQAGWTIWLKKDAGGNTASYSVDWASTIKESPIGGGVIAITASGADSNKPVILVPSEDQWISVERGAQYAVRAIVAADSASAEVAIGYYRTRDSDGTAAIGPIELTSTTAGTGWQVLTSASAVPMADTSQIAPCIILKSNTRYYICYVGCWIETSPSMAQDRPVYIGEQSEWYFRADDNNVLYSISSLLTSEAANSVTHYGLREETYEVPWIKRTDQAKEYAAQVINTRGVPKDEGSIAFVPSEAPVLYSLNGVRRAIGVPTHGDNSPWEALAAEVFRYKPLGTECMIEAVFSVRSWDPITRIINAFPTSVSARADAARAGGGGGVGGGGGGTSQIPTYQVNGAEIGQELTLDLAADAAHPGLYLTGTHYPDSGKVKIEFGPIYGTSAGTVAEGAHLHDDRYGRLAVANTWSDNQTYSKSAGTTLALAGGTDAVHTIGLYEWTDQHGAKLVLDGANNYLDVYTRLSNTDTLAVRIPYSTGSAACVGIGMTPSYKLDVAGNIRAYGGDIWGVREAASWPQIAQYLYQDTDTYYPMAALYRARGTIASPAAVTAGTTLAGLNMYGYNAGAYSLAAQMYSVADAVGATAVQGRIHFGLRKTDNTTVEPLVIRTDRIECSVGVLTVGSTTASSGAIRLPNAQAVKARNAGNTADIELLASDASDYVVLGGGGTGGAQVRLRRLTVEEATSSPFAISSTALCTNLNADLLDGYHASSFALSGHTHDHATLTNVLPDQHHAQVHSLDGSDHSGSLSWSKVNKSGSSLADLATRNHSDLTGVTADQHHAQVHAFTGADHTGVNVSSPSDGQVLRYNGSAWANAQLSHGDLGGVSADQHHPQVHALDGADHSGTLSWSKVNKTGSNLTDLATRLHNDLQSLQGGASGEYYHLTNTQLTGLTGGGNTSLHLHDDRYGRLSAANTWQGDQTYSKSAGTTINLSGGGDALHTVGLYEWTNAHGAKLVLDGANNRLDLYTRLSSVDTLVLRIPYAGGTAGYLGVRRTPEYPLDVSGNIRADGGQIWGRNETAGWPIIGQYLHHDTATYYPMLALYRTRGTIASPTAVTAGVYLGAVNVYGYNASAYSLAAQMYAIADAVGSTAVQGRIHFGLRKTDNTTVEPLALRVDRTSVPTGVLEVGSTVASTGAIRLPSQQAITARNAGNTADIELIRTAANDNVYVGGAGAGGAQVQVRRLVVDEATLSPLSVTSTVLCSNLNADLLDGYHASSFASSSHTHDHSTLTNVLPDQHHARQHSLGSTSDHSWGTSTSWSTQLSLTVPSGQSTAQVRASGTSCEAKLVADTSGVGRVSAGGAGSYVDLHAQSGSAYIVFSNDSYSYSASISHSADYELTVSSHLKASTFNTGSGRWTLGTYSSGAPSATGYVTVTIGGTTYKLLAST